MKKLTIGFFVLTLALSIALRLFRLGDNPAGFFADEASIGYNAFSILSTGMDQYGVSFPIFFKSFGDYRPPFAIYSAIPFVALLGLNEVSTRLPSAFYGVLLVLIMYSIAKETGSRSLGLWTGFITATMPWLFHYNRTGFEFTVYVTFFSLTILLFLKAPKNPFSILPAFITSALTLYTYQPARLLVPLLLCGVLCMYRKIYIRHTKMVALGAVSFCILSLPLVVNLIHGEGLARFNQVSVFSTKLSLDQSIVRIIHNYLIQLSPLYLVKGDPTFITRHFVGGLSPVLITTFPFLFVGLLSTLLKLKTSNAAQLLIYWLLLYPIAGAVTADAPFTSRSLIGAPLFALLIAIGIKTTVTYTQKFLHRYILNSVVITIILVNAAFFARFYFVEYPLYSSGYWGWQYGPREIMKYFLSHQSLYDDLYLAPDFNEPGIFLLFYDPERLCKNKCKVGNLTELNPTRRQLFAISTQYWPQAQQKGLIDQMVIQYPNGSPAFYIASNR